MVEISRIAGTDIIMFSAESVEAEIWMDEIYGRNKICFKLPADQARALAFNLMQRRLADFRLGSQQANIPVT